MSSITFFFIFIPFLAFILLAINLTFAPHNPYQEKDSVFECGFHSFLGQNRTQFSISFFIFALLFLLFDLEILLVYPYIVSGYNNSIYGLVNMLIFFLVLTLGFAFELGKKALSIDSRQTSNVADKNTNVVSKINDFNKKNFNNVSFVNNNVRHMSSYLGHSNRFSKTLNNSSCFRGFSTSAILSRNLDSYDNVDNITQQIADPNTSEEAIRRIRDETMLDLERLNAIRNTDESTTRRRFNADTVYENAQDRLDEFEQENGNENGNENGDGSGNGNGDGNGNRDGYRYGDGNGNRDGDGYVNGGGDGVGDVNGNLGGDGDGDEIANGDSNINGNGNGDGDDNLLINEPQDDNWDYDNKGFTPELSDGTQDNNGGNGNTDDDYSDLDLDFIINFDYSGLNVDIFINYDVHIDIYDYSQLVHYIPNIMLGF